MQSQVLGGQREKKNKHRKLIVARFTEHTTLSGPIVICLNVISIVSRESLSLDQVQKHTEILINTRFVRNLSEEHYIRTAAHHQFNRPYW